MDEVEIDYGILCGNLHELFTGDLYRRWQNTASVEAPLITTLNKMHPNVVKTIYGDERG